MITNCAYKFNSGISNINYKKQNKQTNNINCLNTSSSQSYIPTIKLRSYFPNISFRGNETTYNKDGIEKLDIPNLHCTNQNGVRGESLSHKRNKRFIPMMKDYGIKQVIDLKTSDHSENFKYYVESNGLSYSHFPMDSEKATDREIIDYLPEFFKAINKGEFYIACAQGLHRTDIALAVNYFFNKDANEEPPILYGHQSSEGVRYSDILRRTNSIFKALTDEDKAILGIENLDEKTYKAKKDKLIDANNQYNLSCFKK